MVDRVLECPKARLLFGRSNGGPLLRLYGSVTDFRPWSTVVNFVPSLTFAPADVRRRLRAYADEIFPLANDAVEFVTMLLLNKHYVEHLHVPLAYVQRKQLMHTLSSTSTRRTMRSV